MIKFNLSADNLRIMLASTEFTVPAKDNLPALESVAVTFCAIKNENLEDVYRIDVASTDRYMLFHTMVKSLPGTSDMLIDDSITDATFRLPPSFFDAVKTVLKEPVLKWSPVTIALETDAWEIATPNSTYKGTIDSTLNYPAPASLYKLFKDEHKELFPVCVTLSAQNLARINKAENLAKVSAPSAGRPWTMGTTEPDRAREGRPDGPVTLVSSWARILLMPIRQYSDGRFMDYYMNKFEE